MCSEVVSSCQVLQYGAPHGRKKHVKTRERKWFKKSSLFFYRRAELKICTQFLHPPVEFVREGMRECEDQYQKIKGIKKHSNSCSRTAVVEETGQHGAISGRKFSRRSATIRASPGAPLSAKPDADAEVSV